MNNLETLKRLYNEYTKKFLSRIFISIFFSILVAGSTSAIAWLLDPAIKKIFIEKDQSLMFIIPIAIIVAFFLKGASLYLAKTILIKVAFEVTKILQYQVVNSLIKSDNETMNNKHSGKFISHITYDIQMITNLVSNTILNLTKDLLTLIGLVGVMFYQNWRLAMFAIIMIPLASYAAKSLGKRIGKVSTQAQERSGILTSYLLEIFKNHKIIKIFQRENFESERSENFVNKLKEKQIKIFTVVIRATPIMEVLTGIMIAILIFYSGKLIMTGQLSINNFFSFLAAMMLAYQPVRSLATINIGIGQGLSAGKRILPIIDMKVRISKNENEKTLLLNNGSIKFKNVSFNYLSNTENKVLKNINIEINGEKMTALVGHSGSGKSTMLNLIPRIYDPVNGSILIDEEDIKDINLVSLRNQISIVDQNTTLFDDTVLNNIKYAKPTASKEEIIKASELAMCSDFINNLENGFDTTIGENGVKLSGGEKQRLSIARAFLKDSKIILLDEATSSLDSETEEKIQKAIDKLTSNKTTVVIAHRLSTILNSDRIYVLDKGSVVAEGKHDQLLNSSDIYKNLYNKQIKNN